MDTLILQSVKEAAQISQMCQQIPTVEDRPPATSLLSTLAKGKDTEDM